MNTLLRWGNCNKIRPGNTIQKFFKPKLTKSVNVKSRECRTENDLKMTYCYDNYYMKKLNCSFPWLKNYEGPLEKCGAFHKTDDLVELIENVTDPQNDMFAKELAEEGCSVPNCENLNWIEVKSDTVSTSNKTYTNFYAYFLATKRVYIGFDYH